MRQYLRALSRDRDGTFMTHALRLSPLAGRGRNARGTREFRVRGTLRESNCHRPRGDSPSPQPSPRKRGEGEEIKTLCGSSCEDRWCGRIGCRRAACAGPWRRDRRRRR
ncbi:hypothetical protein B5V03_02635 [Bradyrhizobium betae]|uniref:Uncharacterized protein n=1 Tax=Bradyrhizobium betae TaxID=244734 RepID=A0A4Q1VQ27_9BRAD|nr:hypothetical protein B5V03_02635 [Bradyrhizobium betae]